MDDDRRARAWLDALRRLYRHRSTDVTLEATRALCAGLGILTLWTAGMPPAMRGQALAAHLLLVLGALAVLALLPWAARHGHAGPLLLASTVGTIVWFAAYSAAYQDVPRPVTVVGVLALVEALVRYGVRGVPVSAVPVTLVALVWPQRDLGGATLDPAAVLAIATLVCGLTLVVRETGRRSARALAAASQGFAEATLHLPLGVGVLDADGRVVQANPALVALLGPDLEGRRLRDRLRETGDALNPVLDGRSPDEPVDAETVDGRWLQLGACTLQAPGPVRTVVHARDITAERQERADLLHASRHDALTGLLVRSAGERVLQDALRAGSTAVLFLDMDGFKRLNDTAGHSVGDVVLEQAGSRLAAALRPSEVPVRWGGDEFVVVCRHVDDGDVLDSIAERLLGVLREPFRVDDRPLVTLTASVGAVLASPGQSPATALAAADHAMYLAKAAGGDRCVRWPAGAPPVPSPRSSSRAETADR